MNEHSLTYLRKLNPFKLKKLDRKLLRVDNDLLGIPVLFLLFFEEFSPLLLSSTAKATDDFNSDFSFISSMTVEACSVVQYRLSILCMFSIIGTCSSILLDQSESVLK